MEASRRSMRSSGVVIAYHAIGECPREADRGNLFVSPDRFERHMRYLAARANVVPLADLVGGGPGGGRRKVAITFDDGYRNVLRNAAPILAQHRLPSTVFVPTANIGGANSWDESGSCDLSIMDEGELVEAESLGLSIESHGHAHIDLSRATREDAYADIARSIDLLQDVLDRRPRYLAYPYGRSSDEAREIVRELGLEAAFSLDRLHDGRFAYERVQITPLDRGPMFAFKASGRYVRWRRSPLLSKTYEAVKPIARRLLLGERSIGP